MITQPQYVLVGRNEESGDTGEVRLIEHLSRVAEKVHELLRRRAMSRGDAWIGADKQNIDRSKASAEEAFWLDWNVIACVGVWSNWSTYVLMHVPLLGVHPAPPIQSQWATPAQGYRIQQVDTPTGSRAPVLYGTSNLLSTSNWPIHGVGDIFATRALEGLIAAEKQLDFISATYRPDTQTVGGLDKVLEGEGARFVLPKLEGGAHAKFRTYIIEQRKKSGQSLIPGVRFIEEENVENKHTSMNAELERRV